MIVRCVVRDCNYVKLVDRMIDSILVILRDREISLPAGAILISPWVDLTHSFPSVAGDGSLDYIPAQGFLNKPSLSWPPPNAEQLELMANLGPKKSARESEQGIFDGKGQSETTKEAMLDSAKAKFLAVSNPAENVIHSPNSQDAGGKSGNVRTEPDHHLSINIKGETIIIKDQIQMYTTNQLLSHPLVSPVLQPSLGGLPPLLILTGGGELLRDEQIYLAHKAANPSKYSPGELYLQKHPEALETITKWRPTNVQLQVWDDLCHVAPVLSFTKPAKYMYRSIAQFGAWCLARAQNTDIQIQDDDVSIKSSSSDTEKNQSDEISHQKSNILSPGHDIIQGQVGKAGSALPPFRHHMIRQRVDRHGNIYPLEPASSLPGLQIPANEIGVIKPGPVSKWREAQDRWNAKFAREKRRIQTRRAKEMAEGFEGFGDDEVPPPSALAGRRRHNMPQKWDGKKPRSWGMSLWSLWGSSHDEKMVMCCAMKPGAKGPLIS